MAEDKKIHLSKKDVLKAFWKWTFFSHSNYNYERLQASGVLQSMSHLPEKLYPGDKEEQQKFMERHMSFYNTEPHFGGIINGMVVAMEDKKEELKDVLTEEEFLEILKDPEKKEKVRIGFRWFSS